MSIWIALGSTLALSASGCLLYLLFWVQRSPEGWIEDAKIFAGGSKKIVFFGDSLFRGGIGYDLVADLKPRFPQPAVFINAAVNGDRAIELMARINPVIYLQPDEVFVLGGTNDVLLDTTEVSFRHQFASILATLKARTQAKVTVLSLPLLAGPVDSALNLRIKLFSAIIQELALKNGAAYVPVFEAHLKRRSESGRRDSRTLARPYPGVWGAVRYGVARKLRGQSLEEISASTGSELTIDGIHLNTQGGQLVTDAVAKTFAPAAT